MQLPSIVCIRTISCSVAGNLSDLEHVAGGMLERLTCITVLTARRYSHTLDMRIETSTGVAPTPRLLVGIVFFIFRWEPLT